ncbi:uncharacterized protein HGUI_02462 [Hanseniaspora guilliermondii]|uniref:Uncharacterized protein n=1 Tax=Hanseniaspora guilliermondii TaxID=56406 RepID=A0A1L0FL19_9ASCO|nr:uncharacterized protein HGUI_02462 [Hanseniaspora guilliermondii]
MSLKINVIRTFDFGVNKYLKFINKVTHGYNIKAISKKSSDIQYAIFFKGFNSLETTNLMLYLIENVPLIKVLNIDFNYEKYLKSKFVDSHYKTKISSILKQINCKYWQFNLPDFESDLFEQGNVAIIDSYLNNEIVELINFIKEGQESLSSCINSTKLPLLLIMNNYAKDLTFNSNSFYTNDDPFFKINAQTFLKSNYKNVKMTINFYKYFLYLNKKILKKDIYNIQFCSTKNKISIKMDDINIVNKVYNQFRNYGKEQNIKNVIKEREWLFDQQSALLQQFWKSLEMEYPYKGQESFSIQNPYKVDKQNLINHKFLTVKTVSSIYYMTDKTMITVPFGPGKFGVVNIPIEKEHDGVAMHRMESYQTKNILNFLMAGTYGEIYIFNQYDKITRLLKEYWKRGIHDPL